VGTATALVLAMAISIAALGCGRKSAPPPPPLRQFEIGAHHILLSPPVGWDVFEHGSEVLIRHGEAQLTLSDLGPVGPRGIRRELERARDLWRQGKDKDARWRLRTIPVPDEAFETKEQREAYWSAWHQVSAAPEDVRLGEVEVAFDTLLARTAALSGSDFDTTVRWGLAKIEDEKRRAVGQRRPLSIGGRQAVVLDTWERTSHGYPKRVAMVWNEGRLLSLVTDRGLFEETGPVFDSTLASLSFAATDSAAAPTSER
jgi:hypothetical protein